MAGKEGEQPQTKEIPTIRDSFDRIYNLCNEGRQYETTIQTEKGQVSIFRTTSSDNNSNAIPSGIRVHFDDLTSSLTGIGFEFAGYTIGKDNGIDTVEFKEKHTLRGLSRSRRSTQFKDLFPCLEENELEELQKKTLFSLANFLEKATDNSNAILMRKKNRAMI